MHAKLKHPNYSFICRNSVFILAISWLIGVVVGILLCAAFPLNFISLMHTILCSRVSIVGLAAVLIVPLLSSAVAVHFMRLRLVYLIANLKGICYGFCIFILLKNFGSAAWLMRWFILFSDNWMLIPLFYFWIRHLKRSQACLCDDTIRCLAISLLIGAVDYFVVSPFTVALIMKV